MGLDMYLQVEEYVSGYEHQPQGERDRYAAALKLAGCEAIACKESPSVTIKVVVAYWRKANAVHAWFVNNVADGVDDCRPVYVPIEKLRELKSIAERSLLAYRAGNLEECKRLMRPKSGFFFGNTEVDQYYEGQMQETIDQLAPLVNEDRRVYYRASW